MTSVGLVLGAGGVIGGAYESGALAALHEATGWDARTADLIVGTSAGAGIAASLRLGLSPVDHLARSLGIELSEEGRALLGDDLPATALPDRSFIPRPALPMAPWLVAPAMMMPGPVRPLLALAGWLPRGSHDPRIITERLRAIEGRQANDEPERPTEGNWPEAPTWICALRLRDGRRTVFGRDDLGPPELVAAVEASSAVPTYFRPVQIGEASYVDGGIYSPSNADLLTGLGFDLGIVISPMSTVPSDPPWSPRRWSRSLQAGLLRGEIGRVEKSGTRVLDLSPETADADGFGLDLLDGARRTEVARQAYDSVRRRLSEPDLRDLVAVLTVTENATTAVDTTTRSSS